MTMRLLAGLETLTRVPDDVVDRLFAGQWPSMRALRHRIAHGYGVVNIRRVDAMVLQDVPGAMAAIQDEIDAD